MASYDVVADAENITCTEAVPDAQQTLIRAVSEDATCTEAVPVGQNNSYPILSENGTFSEAAPLTQWAALAVSSEGVTLTEAAPLAQWNMQGALSDGLVTYHTPSSQGVYGVTSTDGLVSSEEPSFGGSGPVDAEDAFETDDTSSPGYEGSGLSEEDVVINEEIDEETLMYVLASENLLFSEIVGTSLDGSIVEGLLVSDETSAINYGKPQGTFVVRKFDPETFTLNDKEEKLL